MALVNEFQEDIIKYVRHGQEVANKHMPLPHRKQLTKTLTLTCITRHTADIHLRSKKKRLFSISKW